MAGSWTSGNGPLPRIFSPQLAQDPRWVGWLALSAAAVSARRSGRRELRVGSRCGCSRRGRHAGPPRGHSHRREHGRAPHAPDAHRRARIRRSDRRAIDEGDRRADNRRDHHAESQHVRSLRRGRARDRCVRCGMSQSPFYHHRFDSVLPAIGARAGPPYGTTRRCKQKWLATSDGVAKAADTASGSASCPRSSEITRASHLRPRDPAASAQGTPRMTK